MMLPTDKDKQSVYRRPITLDNAGLTSGPGQRKSSYGTLDNLLANLLQGTDDGLRDQATKMFNLP